MRACGDFDRFGEIIGMRDEPAATGSEPLNAEEGSVIVIVTGCSTSN
jgi:hypothetical protein